LGVSSHCCFSILPDRQYLLKYSKCWPSLSFCIWIILLSDCTSFNSFFLADVLVLFFEAELFETVEAEQINEAALDCLVKQKISLKNGNKSRKIREKELIYYHQMHLYTLKTIKSNVLLIFLSMFSFLFTKLDL